MNRFAFAVAACAAAAFTLPAAAQTPGTAGEVARTLQQARAALGAAALDRGGTLQMAGTVASNGLKGTGTSAGLVGGTKFAERSSLPPTLQADGYDGSVAWNQDQSGLVWVDGSEAGVSQEIDSAYGFNDTLFTRGAGGAAVTWGGYKNDGGRRYATLSVTPPHSLLPMQVWIDAVTHLPARYVVAVGPVNYVTTLTDYRRAGGLMVPYRTHSESTQGNSSDVQVTSAKISANDETAVAKPVSNVHDFSMTGGGTSTTIPIELVDNHVYLNVTLNGKGPYRFIFDTGGSNVIDPDVAQEIGVSGKGSFQGSGAGSATESFSFAKVDSLGVGDAVLRDQVFAVIPIRQGFGVSAGQHVDGLIGFEVLARFITTFDYANRKVVLTMPGAQPPAGADVIPFVFGATQPQFACGIDGVAARCAVDTGARDSITLLGPFVAAHPQVVPATRSAEGVNGFGVGGGAKGMLGRLSSLQIGTFALNDIIADYSTQTGGFFASPFLAANVGGNVWKRFTVTFDYGKQTMSLQPNAGLATRDAYERAGLFLVTTGGKVVVYDVRPGTPAADAGLVKGDSIVSIDGTPATLQQARDAINGPAGTVLHLQVAAKDGTTRAVTVTLRDWV
ncbi:MAG TPA: aspartyl protease family protein [Candidatus Baltobacteraceae bacterium]|nr:aspartyl protease family protein [Candidatus Baltobacteraceae bacterium]